MEATHYLTGSRALNFWFPNQFPIKLDSDYDIVSAEQIKPTNKVDVAPDGLLSLEVCKRYVSEDTIETPIGTAKVVNPVGLMLFKRSHLHRPVDFQKHIRHYHYLKSLEFDLYDDDDYNRLLKERIKLTKAMYGDRTPKLNKSKKDFFDDEVVKIYEHDDIHYATCYGDRPIYEELKPDNNMVWCSKAKWNNLSHKDKVNCVREETFVIALERYVIPKLHNKEKYPPINFCFGWALERVCTTLTSGWFRDFAIDNWEEIRNHNYNFLERFMKWMQTN